MTGIGDAFQGVFDSFVVIKDTMIGFKDDLLEFLDYLNPFYEKFLLKIAFVPEEGYFIEFYNSIADSFDSKLPFIKSLKEFFDSVTSAISGQGVQTMGIQSTPEITVVFPARYGGGTFSIVDFSYFAEYRIYILNFIRFAGWFFFLKRLFRKIPLIIYN